MLAGGLATGGVGLVVGGLVGGGAGTATAALTGNRDIVIPAESIVHFTMARSRGAAKQQCQRRHEHGPAERRSKADNHSRLMSEAMQAAPKPLSILTTETLGEQVFSMPSSAATPPNDAP